MTVDGFGFGTLTGESCLKNVHCHTDRASWDAILVTVVAFGALMWKTCGQSHRFGLARVGGGIPLGGGRRTENRDHIYIYGAYIHTYIYIHISYPPPRPTFLLFCPRLDIHTRHLGGKECCTIMVPIRRCRLHSSVMVVPICVT